MEKVKWHHHTVSQVCSALGTDTQTGLSSAQAKHHLEQYGPNELARKKGKGIFSMFLDQMKDYMVLILLVASIVSLVVGEITDSLVIIGIVIVNACLGVFQEYRAGKALEALKKMTVPNAKVIRDGKQMLIPSVELVPGDVVSLETGDYIPADVRLFQSINLKIEEAALTGESVPVEKNADIPANEDAGLGDQVNCAFMSTLITYGRGYGIVTSTGMNTVIGKIAEMIQEGNEESTPLQKKLAKMGKLLGTGCLLICAIVFALGLIRGESVLEMFMTAISLAVAAIPEGLPAVVTIVLALGMQRMAKHNSIIKRLHAVETLGSTTVICSDKTGTLTQNQMTIVRMYTAGMDIYVNGEGYKPFGEMTLEGEKITIENEPALQRLLEIQALCNDARLEHITENKADEWRIVGDPTEGAMIVAAAKAGMEQGSMNKQYPRAQEIPFDSQRKLMTTMHTYGEGMFLALTKGAPDILIERCTRIMRRNGAIEEITADDIKTILEHNKALAGQAYRVLAMAFRPISVIPSQPSTEEDEKDLVFCGLVGMIDPPRTEAMEAIKVCKAAGIRVVMITGDYRDTAAAIAKQLGIISSENEVMSGAELDLLDDLQLMEVAQRVSVYARVSPEHKVRIVQAIRSAGGIAAMTGDGVNDAPALKRSDIGVAMGITGTDVTKESADMIIMDDNFSSIVKAVEEGRVIYNNIRKFVFFLLSCNVGEILIIFISMLLGWPIPLLPIHLLWVNLLTDAFPALALGTEKKEPGLMSEPPRNPKEPIINKDMIVNIVVQSLVLCIVVLAAFFIGWQKSEALGRTYALVALILCELFRAYSARSEKNTIFKLGVFSNRNMNLATVASLLLLIVVLAVPTLRQIFNVEVLHWLDWDIVIVAGLMPLIFGELVKVVKRFVGRKK